MPAAPPLFRFDDTWPTLPAGVRLGDVGGVAIDREDRIHVFQRGTPPMLVFDRAGTLLDAWGEGIFTSPHGIHHGHDGCLYCTDDGDHTLRKFDTRGRLLLTIGIPGVPSGFMSGKPFNRCTHSALSPSGDIYITDGYRNACVHCYSPTGQHLRSWGGSGSGPGEFYVPHNIVCDAGGTLYVADRENHRIQRFDGEGRYLGQWNNLHRPMALWLQAATPDRECAFYVGEAAPSFNVRFPNLGPRISILDAEGRLQARFGDIGPGHASDRFIAPHGIAVDSQGDVYVGEVAHVAWPHLYPDEPVPEGLRTLRRLVRIRDHENTTAGAPAHSPQETTA